MSSFNARLRLPGQSKLPLGVEVDISNERMTLTTGDRTLAAWSTKKLDVTTHSDGFHIRIDGEELVLNVTDSARFAAALGIEEQRPSRWDVIAKDQPRYIEPSRADNLFNRLRNTKGEPDPYQPFPEPTPGERHVEDMQRRVAEVARALASDKLSPAEAFAQWLTLLKEINRRHGQGSMPTDEYYRLNTELLDLIPVPTPQPA